MNPYLFVLFIAGVLLVLGIIFAFIDHALERKRNLENAQFMRDDLLGEIQGIIEETLNYSMDMIPGKLIQARKMMEQEGGEKEWTP